MAERVPQSIAMEVMFMAYLASDHITPATGKTISITISKNHGALANPNAGATNAAAISNGCYYVALATADINTLGNLWVHGAEGTIDDVNVFYRVVEANSGGFAGIPSVAAGASGGLPLSVDTSGRVDVLKVNGTSQTARDIGASVLVGDKTGFSLSTTGADLILKSSTFVQAIVAAINEFATYGLTALNTLLVTTGIKATTIPNATIGAYATGQDPATLLLVTPANKINTDASNAVKSQAVAVAAGGIQSTSFSAGAIDSAALNATAENAIADAMLDRSNAIDTGVTPRGALKIATAVGGGQLSGAGTATEVLMNPSGTKNRATLTVDASGNRTASILDLS